MCPELGPSGEVEKRLIDHDCGSLGESSQSVIRKIPGRGSYERRWEAGSSY